MCGAFILMQRHSNSIADRGSTPRQQKRKGREYTDKRPQALTSSGATSNSGFLSSSSLLLPGSELSYAWAVNLLLGATTPSSPARDPMEDWEESIVPVRTISWSPKALLSLSSAPAILVSVQAASLRCTSSKAQGGGWRGHVVEAYHLSARLDVTLPATWQAAGSCHFYANKIYLINFEESLDFAYCRGDNVSDGLEESCAAQLNTSNGFHAGLHTGHQQIVAQKRGHVYAQK